MVDIRPYRDTDFAACLAIFDSNFASGSERSDFDAFLQSPVKMFHVIEHDGQLIGCGGYEIQASIAQLRWGMIRRDLQRQGLGRYLLLYRLKQIGNVEAIQFVQATVPTPLARFYEKNGLKPQSEGDGVTELRMKMQVCTA